MPAPSLAAPRLVVHLVHQLDTCAAENGLLDLIRHMPPGHYRHTIVCLKAAAGQGAFFHQRGVEVITLNKREGKDFAHYVRMFRTLRQLHPDLVHTRNLGALEGQLVAALAGVKLRVHGEHARARSDPPGRRLRYPLLRRLLRPLISHFITVSAELEQWLIDSVGAPAGRVSQITNGVDSVHFHPRLGPPAVVGPPGFMVEHAFVVGSAGPFDEAANYPALIDAFLRLIASADPAHRRLRLLLVGDGPTRAACLEQLRRAGQAERAWLPGRRPDLAPLMRAMDVFVLPGTGEASPTTILEAMASALPVIASPAGSNGELISTGFSGLLVPAMTPALLAAAISDYCRLPELVHRHGTRARARIIANHSLPAMAQGYMAVYDALLARQRRQPAAHD